MISNKKVRHFFRIVSVFAFMTLSGFVSAIDLDIARTSQGLQKKVVIIDHGVKLYANPTGEDGKVSNFMDVYFVLDGGGDRIPVTRSPNKTTAEGWLPSGKVSSWDTLQMITFSSQTNRKLAKIYSDEKCAQEFGKLGVDPKSCTSIGEEPNLGGADKVDYSMLVPALSSGDNVYKGGFVRVSSGKNVQVVNSDGETKAGASSPKLSSGLSSGAVSGYDVVFIVDTTYSMDAYFRPASNAIQRFIEFIQSSAASGEKALPVRVGLLFYRDRKVDQDCDIGYLTQWSVPITGATGVESTQQSIKALSEAEATGCGSEEHEEAVYDALYRGLEDPAWSPDPGTIKVIALIGDAPPHEDNPAKNPRNITLSAVHGVADTKNIRFLTFKIDSVGDGSEHFDDIALARSGGDEMVGRAATITADENNPEPVEEQLYTSLVQEWDELVTPLQKATEALVTRDDLKDPKKANALKMKLNISDYAWPIIVSHLPTKTDSAGNELPDFAAGWVPINVNNKKVVDEFVFMNKTRMIILKNVIESILASVESAESEGVEAFIDTVRHALSAMLKLRPEDVFKSGESIGSVLKKKQILPFPTAILNFTANEVNTWKKGDFTQIIEALGEKLNALNEFMQSPGNIKKIGGSTYFYVPRHLFP